MASRSVRTAPASFVSLSARSSGVSLSRLRVDFAAKKCGEEGGKDRREVGLRSQKRNKFSAQSSIDQSEPRKAKITLTPGQPKPLPSITAFVPR